MDVELAIAIVGAVGTVISAYLVSRVRTVQKTVNGHTEKLERRIEALKAALDRETLT